MVKYALDALSIGRKPAWLDTLAASYAKGGDFDKAVEKERGAYEISKPPSIRVKNDWNVTDKGKHRRIGLRKTINMVLSFTKNIFY